MKRYLEIEKTKQWFSERETELISIDGSAPRWTAEEIGDNLEAMAAASLEQEQNYITHVDALLDLVDNPLGMVDCRHTRAVIEDAAKAFAILIFENRRLQAELKEHREQRDAEDQSVAEKE